VTRTVFGSLARIADFDEKPYDVLAIEPSAWQTGDYVAAEVTGTPTRYYNIEDRSGEMVAVETGTLVVGALGVRAATLEGVGSWRDVCDGHMHALTSAGLFGFFTSYSRLLDDPVSLIYKGHVCRDGKPSRMSDFALRYDGGTFRVPTIMLVGTSMSAGKTTTGRLVIRLLSLAGYRVIGSKLTGAGRYRDIRAFRRAGAFEVYDFVDVGLPSTVVPEASFRAAIRPLLNYIDSRGADFLVAEAGASPLEPYNGAAAMDLVGDNNRLTILCASDPYAAVGVQEAYRFKPDLVSGPAANTSAAIDLVDKLTGVPALNVLDPDAPEALRALLAAKLGVELESCDLAGALL
jgi:hypothetical protein